MGFLSRIKKTYSRIDSKVGGILPGGVPRTSTKTSTPSLGTPLITKKEADAGARGTVVSSGSSSGGSSGGSSGSSSPLNLVPEGNIQDAIKKSGSSTPVIETKPQYTPLNAQQLRARQQGEYYNTYPSGQGTSSFRPYTQEEIRTRDRINQRDEKIRTNIVAGAGVVENVFGGIFNAPLTDDQRKRLTGRGYVTNQFNVAKENVKAENDVREAIQVSQKLDRLNRDYNSGKISWEEYNASWNYYSNTPEYQRAINSPERKNVYQKITESNLSQGTKENLAFTAAVTDAASFLAPPVRVLRGGSMVIQGVDTLNVAATNKERNAGLFNLGFGTALVASGFGGAGSVINPSSSVSSGVKRGFTSRIVSGTGSLVLPGTFSVIGGRQRYKETGNVGVSVAAGLGYMAGLKAPSISRGITRTAEKLTKSGTEPNRYLYSNVLKTKQINKNKFELLKKYFERFEAQIKERLRNVKTRKEQDKIIKEYENKITDPEARAEYRRWIKEELEGKGFLKEDIKIVTIGEGFSKPSDILKPGTNVMDSDIGVSSFGKPTIDAAEVGKTKFKDDNNILSVTAGSGLSTANKSGSKTRQKSKNILSSSLVSSQALSSAQKTAQKTKQKTRETQMLGSALLTSQAQRLDTLSKLAQKMRSRRPQEPRPKEPFKPFVWSSEESSSTPSGISKEKIKLFQAYYKRKGKDKLLGEFESEGEAEKKLKDFLDFSISASGYVTKRGKKIKLRTGGRFRPSKSKKDPFRIVERRKYRLSRRKELSDIGKAKRNKKFF